MRLKVLTFAACALVIISGVALAAEPYVLSDLQRTYSMHDWGEQTVTLAAPTSYFRLDVANYSVLQGDTTYQVFEGMDEFGNPRFDYQLSRNQAWLYGYIRCPEIGLTQSFEIATPDSYSSGPVSIPVFASEPVHQIQVEIDTEWLPGIPPVPGAMPVGNSPGYPLSYIGSATLTTPEPSSLMALALGGLGILVGVRKRRNGS